MVAIVKRRMSVQIWSSAELLGYWDRWLTIPRMSFKLPSTISSGPMVISMQSSYIKRCLTNICELDTSITNELQSLRSILPPCQPLRDTGLGSSMTCLCLLHAHSGLLVVPSQACLRHDFLKGQWANAFYLCGQSTYKQLGHSAIVRIFDMIEVAHLDKLHAV